MTQLGIATPVYFSPYSHFIVLRLGSGGLFAACYNSGATAAVMGISNTVGPRRRRASCRAWGHLKKGEFMYAKERWRRFWASVSFGSTAAEAVNH